MGCREFVLKATQGGGRPVTFLKDSGKKVPACLFVDPPLQSLCLKEDSAAEGSFGTSVPVVTLQAIPARKDQKISGSSAFRNLEEADCECAVAIRYGAEGLP